MRIITKHHHSRQCHYHWRICFWFLFQPRISLLQKFITSKIRLWSYLFVVRVTVVYQSTRRNHRNRRTYVRFFLSIADDDSTVRNCSTLQSTLDQHGGILDCLKGHFDNLPIHQWCYNFYQNSKFDEQDYSQRIGNINNPLLLRILWTWHHCTFFVPIQWQQLK